MNTETACRLAAEYENLATERDGLANRLDVLVASLKDMERRLDHARIMNYVWSTIHGSESAATIRALEGQVASKRESVNQAAEALAKAEEASGNAYGELQAAFRQLRREA